MTYELPAEWVAKAFRAYNGELAWVRSDVIEVSGILAAAGLAILGGEAWLVRYEGEDWSTVLPQTDASPRAGYGSNWYGIFPAAPGQLPGVYAWDFRERWQPASETWEQFCGRAAAHTISVIMRLHPEEDVPPDLSPRVRYNLTYVSPREYDEIVNRPSQS
jgi:hypothetical protein